MYQSPRIRRLRNDLAALERLQAESSVFRFTAQGELPQHYRIVFRGRGLWRDHGKVKVLEKHHVEIKLGSSYPRTIPEIRWLTPVYHPNISEIGMVCLGGYGTHWVPSVQLDELCAMLWDMLRYHNYDIRSPYNRDAALWVAQQQTIRFPTDDRPLRDLRAALGRVADSPSGSEGAIPAARAGTNGSGPSAPDSPSRLTMNQLRELARRTRRALVGSAEAPAPRRPEPAEAPGPLPANSELQDLVAAQAAVAPASEAAPDGEPVLILDADPTADVPQATAGTESRAEAPASPPLFARPARETAVRPRGETVDVAAEVRRLMAGRRPAGPPADEILFIE